MGVPIVAYGNGGTEPFSAAGDSFVVHEWQGSGSALMHVHYDDDEAWHVLEGTVTFRFTDHEFEAGPGSTVFVPAGVPHTYQAETARYLIILTPRLDTMIDELHRAHPSTHADVYRKYNSELME